MSLVTLNPSKEFCFEVSNPASAKTVFKITSNCDDNLAFKIKTTAPKYYIVRPNTGIISKRSEIEVSINLQPIPSSVKDHKFMLQVARTSLKSGDFSPEDLNQFWKNVKSLDSSAREDHKLKVVLVSSNVVSNTVAEEHKKVEVGGTKTSASEAPATPENIEEEVKVVENRPSEYVSKISTLEQKFTDLQTEVDQKEKDLKELKERESQDDNKAFGVRSAASEFRRRSNAVKKPDQSFNIMHVLIAIFAGLGLGILFGKILF